MRTLLTCAVALLAAAVLAACGGGGSSGNTEAGDKVPASATASTTAFVQFMASLAPSETAEPLDINDATPPTSDTDEPAAI